MLRDRLEPLIAGAQTDVERLRTDLEAWFDDTMARVSGWYKRKTQIILIVIGYRPRARHQREHDQGWPSGCGRTTLSARPSWRRRKRAATAKPGGQSLVGAANDVDNVVKVGIPMGWTGGRGPARRRGASLCRLPAGSSRSWLSRSARRSGSTRSVGYRGCGRSGKPETPLPAAGQRQGKRAHTDAAAGAADVAGAMTAHRADARDGMTSQTCRARIGSVATAAIRARGHSSGRGSASSARWCRSGRARVCVVPGGGCGWAGGRWRSGQQGHVPASTRACA